MLQGKEYRTTDRRELCFYMSWEWMFRKFTSLVADAESATFEVTVKVLDDYFVPKANVPFERHLFRQIVQESEETVDQFVCRLCQRAINCEFGENENDYNYP